MKDLPRFSHPKLLVGSDNFDDAGVYQLTDEIAIIQTLDFFTPMVDDPYLFGQVAAANALSDIYAMGGTPITAMNIAAFPLCGEMELFSQVLQGGAAKVQEAGALLIGGHTVDDQEPKYGLSVCGVAHPDKIVTNANGQKGDLLFMTKRLGLGIINTALKADAATEEELRLPLESMAELNRAGAQAMQKAGVRCATDITGFSFLGHLHEITQASGLGAEIWGAAVPIWPEAAHFAREFLIPGGAYRNQEFLKYQVHFGAGIPEWQQMVFFDPQTSGGLLMAIPPEKAAVLESELEKAGLEYAIVGRLVEGAGIAVFAK